MLSIATVAFHCDAVPYRFAVTLVNVSTADEGIYSISALNPVGGNSLSVLLNVEGEIQLYVNNYGVLSSMRCLTFIHVILHVL